MNIILSPHDDMERFNRALARMHDEKRWVSWDSDLFRFAHPKYADIANFTSGLGAKLNGGRWTPPGGPLTLYAASCPVLAAKETFALTRAAGFTPRELLPRVVKAIEVRIGRVLDLSDGSIRNSLSVSRDRMVKSSWKSENAEGGVSLTQAIGQAAANSGYEGIIVPSAVSDGGVNLAIFMGNLRPKSVVCAVE